MTETPNITVSNEAWLADKQFTSPIAIDSVVAKRTEKAVLFCRASKEFVQRIKDTPYHNWVVVQQGIDDYLVLCDRITHYGNHHGIVRVLHVPTIKSEIPTI